MLGRCSFTDPIPTETEEDMSKAGTYTDPVQAANNRVLRRLGFFLLASAGITFTVLSGASPVPPLLLGIVAIVTLLLFLDAVKDRELAKPGGRAPTDREEFKWMAMLTGLAGAIGLVTDAIHLELTGNAVARTDTVFTVSLTLMVLSLVVYGLTRQRSA
jgi:hypothetical protein